MTREELGNQIAQLRKAKGYSIRELADKCEFNKSTIARIEQGQFSPKFETLEKVVKELDAEITIKHLQS